jgi:hypothetical protein
VWQLILYPDQGAGGGVPLGEPAGIVAAYPIAMARDRFDMIETVERGLDAV